MFFTRTFFIKHSVFDLKKPYETENVKERCDNNVTAWILHQHIILYASLKFSMNLEIVIDSILMFFF